jgi:exopolysaccharide biosynthesis polyprenyl glycosylphosphotransferase
VLIILDLAVTVVVYWLVVMVLGCANTCVCFNYSELLAILVLQAVSIAPIGAYGRRVDFRSVGYACQHMLGFGVAFMLLVVMLYYMEPEAIRPDRKTLIPTIILVSIATLLIRRLLYRLEARSAAGKVLLVIGGKAQTDSMLYWLKVVQSHYTLYYVDPETGLVNGSNQEEKNLLGSTIEDSIGQLGATLEAVVLVCKPEALSPVFQEQLIALNFNIMPVYTVDSFYARNWHVVPLSTLSAPWVFAEGFNLSQNLTYSRLKRAEDVVLSGAAIVVLSPLLLLVAAAVKLSSRGPAIFRQRRVGLMGKKFTLYKFRSMQVGSETGASYTEEKDARITRIGRFLRATRLDELPQFFNVLKGDMSLIGPRAEWDKLVEDYEKQIPYYNFRHLVKPGITGWAQVNYSYGSNVEDARIKLRYDLYYVKYFSFMMDLSIIFKTLYVMIFGKGR